MVLLSWSDFLSVALLLSCRALGDGKRPPLYHCNYCHKDISGTIRIKCAKCPDYDLCVECFSVGAETYPHKCNHPYRVMVSLKIISLLAWFFCWWLLLCIFMMSTSHKFPPSEYNCTRLIIAHCCAGQSGLSSHPSWLECRWGDLAARGTSRCPSSGPFRRPFCCCLIYRH